MPQECRSMKIERVNLGILAVRGSRGPQTTVIEISQCASVIFHLFNTRMKDLSFKISNLLRSIHFAKVPKIMHSFKKFRSIAHSFDIQPACLGLTRTSSLYSCLERVGYWRESWLRKEVSISPFPAGESCREIKRRRRTPGQDPDIRWQEAIQYLTVG